MAKATGDDKSLALLKPSAWDATSEVSKRQVPT
jgi:hypothetical protein